MTKRILPILLLCVVCFSCKKNYSPKPAAYFRIEEQPDHFTSFENEKLSFDVSSQATIATEKKGTEIWLTIRYPQYKAYLYCTYLPISKQNLRSAMDDSYRMAFSHTVKANGIVQQIINLPEQKSGGILYKIEGNVATPRQFFVTDSTTHFFRASLYFDGKANGDSLKPVVQYMDKNIEKLISSLNWKN